jgi:hypothetical protein
MRIVFAISCFVGLSMASFDTIVNQLNNMTSGDRAGQAAAHALAASINGYACWCFFDGEHRGKAKGSPLDDFDNACRTLNWGYTCATHDNGETCIPWESVYNAPTISPNDFSQDFGVLCGNLNPVDQCAEHTCIVESIFIRTINSLVNQQAQTPDEDYKHTNAGFSHVDSCPGFSVGGALFQGCCGDYENSRKPFNKGPNDERKCCNGNTFLDAIFTCCGGSFIALSCI